MRRIDLRRVLGLIAAIGVAVLFVEYTSRGFRAQPLSTSENIVSIEMCREVRTLTEGVPARFFDGTPIVTAETVRLVGANGKPDVAIRASSTWSSSTSFGARPVGSAINFHYDHEIVVEKVIDESTAEIGVTKKTGC